MNDTALKDVKVIDLTQHLAAVFGDREEPPWPGAVWSDQHGHWH